MPKNDNHEALFEKLWSRMNERGEFPLLSNSLCTTISAMKNEDGDFSALVQVVLSDFTLTQKVIRLANSAMYISFGGNTTTVSRALMILGVDVVGHLVIGLKLVEHFHHALSSVQQIEAKLELNRVMLASHIAREITDTSDIRRREQAVVCTLMRQLGRLLVLFYLEQEWQEIAALAKKTGLSDDDAGLEVLGISFEELGLDTAERWGLPTLIHDGMQSFNPAQHDDGISPETHWLRAVTNFSTDVSSLLTKSQSDPEVAKELLEQVTQRYSDALKIESDILLKIPSNLAQGGASTQYLKEIDNLHAQTRQVKIEDAEPPLRECLNELDTLPPGNRGAQVLTMALETMLSSLGLSRAIVFIRDKRASAFVARLGLGANITPILPALHFGEDFSPDVFHLAITNSVGIFIENSRAPKFSTHIPGWFKNALPDAEGFILLPVRSGSGPVALLYGDWREAELVRKIRPNEMGALNELAQALGRFF